MPHSNSDNYKLFKTHKYDNFDPHNEVIQNDKPICFVYCTKCDQYEVLYFNEKEIDIINEQILSNLCSNCL